MTDRKMTLTLPSAESPFGRPAKVDTTEVRQSIKRGRDNLLFALTHEYIGTYKRCNPGFKAIEVLPQRVLTNPSEGVLNNGLDNEDANLICKVHDTFAMNGYVFTILDLLGTGTFGQVFRCIRSDTKEIVAVKVVKNKPAYHAQGLLEIKIARLLNQVHDPKDQRHIVRLLDSFEFHGHVCLVFELLSVSLLDVLTQNQFRGLPLSVVQRFTKQILTALVAMEEADVIHCDLKPENILLVPAPSNPNTPHKQATQPSGDNNNSNSSSGAGAGGQSAQKTSSGSSGGVSSDIKVIDFGSACFEGKTMYSYIQSRFYRSPEVLLGLPYNGGIDMWSLACVCAEMYLGLPLFPGVSQHNQLTRIVEMLGLPPDFMIEGKNGRKYFAEVEPPAASEDKDVPIESSPQSVFVGSTGSHSAHVAAAASATATTAPPSGARYRLKTAEEFAAETNTQVPVLRKYLRYNRLDEVIMRCPLPQKARMTSEQRNVETMRRRCFLDFLQGLFRLNPFERWTARQASSHPFIENTRFDGRPFVPPPDMKINERKLNFMVLTQRKPPPSAMEPSAALTGVRAPSNFSTVPGLLSATSAQFTPLQLAQRRMSDPGLGRSSASTGSTNSQASGPQLLKRGAPAHLPSEPSSTSPGMTESSIPFSNSFNELPTDVGDDAPTQSTAAAPGVAELQETSPGKFSNPISRATSDTIGDSDFGPPERSASDDRNALYGGGANVARAIMRVNSKGRDLHGLAAAMQQTPAVAGSPTQQGHYLAQQTQQQYQQSQYQQFAQAHQQLQQSQSQRSSPHSHRHMGQQIRHQHQQQNTARQQQQQQQQQQAQQRSNLAFPPPPWPQYATQGAPLPPGGPGPPYAHPPLYPAYPGQVASSMHGQLPSQYGVGAMASSLSSGGSPYSSYGYVGSMQDGNSGVLLTDFALALMRPDMDEQRRLMSQTSQQMYWQQAYAAGSPGSMGGGAFGYGHSHSYADHYSAAHMGLHQQAPSAQQVAGSYSHGFGAAHVADPRMGHHAAQQQQHLAGSYDSKTMLSRRRHPDQPSYPLHHQPLQGPGKGLPDHMPAPPTQPIPSVAEPQAESRSNLNNVKRLSGRMGQNKEAGGARSGLSTLQTTALPIHPDLRKPSPTYVSAAERNAARALPTLPETHVAESLTASSVIKISAAAAPSHADEQDRVLAGSYVDPASQHTFRLLRPKDGLGEGSSFLAKEIERRESFVASKPAAGALRVASPATSGSPSAEQSRQNSLDDTGTPRTPIDDYPGGAPAGRPASTHAAGKLGGTARAGARMRRATSKGEAPSEDVMEEWHPFFEADSI